MTVEFEAQREVTRIALASIADAGFALAGSGDEELDGVKERCTQWAARLHGHSESAGVSSSRLT